MIDLNPAIDTPSGDRLGERLDLAKLLGDPVAASKRIADLQAAAETARAAIEEAKQAQTAAQADREKANADIAEQKTAAAKKLKADRDEFEAEIGKARRNVAACTLDLERRETYLESRSKDVETMHADLSRRLEAIKRAASAASS